MCVASFHSRDTRQASPFQILDPNVTALRAGLLKRQALAVRCKTQSHIDARYFVDKALLSGTVEPPNGPSGFCTRSRRIDESAIGRRGEIAVRSGGTRHVFEDGYRGSRDYPPIDVERHGEKSVLMQVGEMAGR